jgi:hypothetical protein
VTIIYLSWFFQFWIRAASKSYCKAITSEEP